MSRLAERICEWLINCLLVFGLVFLVVACALVCRILWSSDSPKPQPEACREYVVMPHRDDLVRTYSCTHPSHRLIIENAGDGPVIECLCPTPVPAPADCTSEPSTVGDPSL